MYQGGTVLWLNPWAQFARAMAACVRPLNNTLPGIIHHSLLVRDQSSG